MHMLNLSYYCLRKLKSGEWGRYDICEHAVPKEKDMKEGFPTVLRTNCEPRKKIHGIQIRSVFMGWKLLKEPAIASNDVEEGNDAY